MSAQQPEIRIFESIDDIPSQQWDACANPHETSRPIDPFTTHRFLKALENSGSVGAGTGWEPHHITLWLGDTLLAAAPTYAKGHSQGEYIFDHNWAHAYENAGGSYYPKIQIAVPFTPASGRRFLCRPGAEDIGQKALTNAAISLTSQNNLSSLHITFCNEDEFDGASEQLLQRTSQQFHWFNDGYECFEDFLNALSSRKRKNIRKERRGAANFGGQIHALSGDQIRPEHWDAFWMFYQDTGMRKWGSPYLTREFFDLVQSNMRNDVLLIMCERDNRFVAGALNFIGQDTIYGRYWGCVEDHRFLHFETCYYQAIDYAIANGLSRVEAGAQGAHKLARGYLPVSTYSLHWFREQSFHNAVDKYLTAERRAVDEEIEVLTEYGPFKKGSQNDQTDGI